VSDNESASTQAEIARAKAVGALLPALRELLHVTNLKWDDVQKDYRLLVINHVIRRQLEAIEAALSLGAVGLGHLAVAFIRTALEEMLWTKFLAGLPLAVSQRLLLALANYDSLRSLAAQREFIGDEEMRSLWYTPAFLDAARQRLTAVEADLKILQKELKWPGRTPSTEWIAKSVDEMRTYRYLHSATSRSVHFSAGEAFRRGWGAPGGIITTDKLEFRVHLYEFALDQLWRLLMSTMEGSMELISEAGIISEDSLTEERLHSLVKDVLELNRVPLVHAHEWNLTPEGPMRFP
jgi:hypothetical protein